MPLTLKFSKQAAALVCSPAKQRILFPITRPQLFLYRRGALGPPKLCWAKVSTGTASDAHEDISGESSPRPRPWSTSPTAEPPLPSSATGSQGATHRHGLGQDACARTGVGEKRGEPGPHGAAPGQVKQLIRAACHLRCSCSWCRDGLVGAACARTLPGR